MVNQIEALRNLTMGFQILIQFVVFVLGLISGYVLLNQATRIHSMVGHAWNAVNLNFKRLVQSRKPPWKPPDNIDLIGVLWSNNYPDEVNSKVIIVYDLVNKRNILIVG